MQCWFLNLLIEGNFRMNFSTMRGGKMKRILNGIIWGLIAVMIVSTNAWSFGRKTIVKVGINAPITGDIPKVGEGTKYAAQMWLEDIRKAGGI
jgi:branched-chain amino acid transport system substrate-binding protein